MIWVRRASGVRFMGRGLVNTSALHIDVWLEMSIHLHYIFRMRTTQLQIRLQPKEKQAFETAAELSGIGLSAWVRERLRRVAIRELEEASRAIPFLDEGAKNGGN
jgi:hypothetical protein